ncbi:hypothetical protein Tco_0049169, partial [Tanacetum coccineum]
MDKGKGQESRADDEGFIEVKKKKLVVKQSNEGMGNSSKMTLLLVRLKALTSGYNKESPSDKGSVFSLCNSFEALNVDNPITEEVAI